MRNAAGLARKGAAGFVAGLVIVGTAWAGVGMAPVSTDSATEKLPVASPEAQAGVADLASSDTAPGSFPDLSVLQPLSGGEFYVGAAKTSLAPDPAYGNWQTEGCVTQDQTMAQRAVEHLAEIPTDPAPAVPPGWPKSPNCIYLGGYGIPGPARPATAVDPISGVNVRSLAISNGAETIVWQTVDAVAYFNTYRDDLCADCGILDIRRAIAERTGGKVKFENVAIGSTHTHHGADMYGAWGGVPEWYRLQMRDRIIDGAAAALAAMKPATIETGSTDARAFNSERRDLYYSTADYGAVWLQARELAVPSDGRTKKKDPPPAEPPVIATLLNFAAHPVLVDDETTVMHGDWPATTSEALAREMGGLGMVFQGGLGNVSPSYPADGASRDGDADYDGYDKALEMGADLVSFLERHIDNGTPLATNEIKAVSANVEHPVTNWALAGLGVANMLDREFLPTTEGGTPPTGGQWGKGGAAPERQCTSAGATGVRSQISGFRVGSLSVVTGPGEMFSNMSQVLKSKTKRAAIDGGQVMVFGQTQDSLGYIIQSFEADPIGGVLTNAPGPTHAAYEETFMLDRCFGDNVIQAQLGVLGRL